MNNTIHKREVECTELQHTLTKLQQQQSTYQKLVDHSMVQHNTVTSQLQTVKNELNTVSARSTILNRQAHSAMLQLQQARNQHTAAQSNNALPGGQVNGTQKLLLDGPVLIHIPALTPSANTGHSNCYDNNHVVGRNKHNKTTTVSGDGSNATVIHGRLTGQLNAAVAR